MSLLLYPFVYLKVLNINKKKGNEWDALAAPQAINRWIEKQIVYYKQQADSMPTLQKNTQPLSDFFYQTVMGK